MEFLLDENVLGLERYLENDVKYRKIGDVNCLTKGTSDPEVAKFAKTNDLVIVTKDDKLIKQCKFLGVDFVSYDDGDFARKIIGYNLERNKN